jgi:hypothetical protein
LEDSEDEEISEEELKGSEDEDVSDNKSEDPEGDSPPQAAMISNNANTGRNMKFIYIHLSSFYNNIAFL